MTERTLPRIGVGLGSRPHGQVAPHSVAVPRAGAATRTIVLRREALLSTPVRAGMLVGASAAVYAVSLAGVSVLQARTDAASVASRAPYLGALTQTRAANDALEVRIATANATIASLIDEYDRVGADLAAYQARLDGLAALVADVEGSAAALPARIKLPSVSIRGTVSSGGGGGSGRSSSGSSGKTGASGG